MAIGRITVHESYFVVTGVLDEHVDYKPLLDSTPPIRLRLGNVITVNSLGVRNFLRFMEACRQIEVELHECSLAFMDALNTIPGMLGVPQRPEILRSIRMIYGCLGCSKEESHTFAVVPELGAMPEVPRRLCSRCGRLLQPVVEASDLFTYLAAGD